MNEETVEDLRARLVALEDETANLRLDYLVTSRRYAEMQISLKELTALSLTAATRAAVAVEKAVLATRKAAFVVEQLAPRVSGTADLAAQRAGKAVTTSVDAAAAATANEAAAGGKCAIESALQAVKIAVAVAKFMNPSEESNFGQQPSMS